MKEGWKYKKLGEVADFQRGLTYSGTDEVDFSSNIVLRSNNVDLATNTLNFEELKYISESVVIPNEKLIRKDTLLMCMSNGSKQHLGKVAYVDRNYPYAFGGFMGLICPNLEELNSKYAYYYCCSPVFKHFLTSLGNGANINNLRFSDISKLSIPLPSLGIQHAIASELDKINELIRLKKEHLKDYDNLAQSIFYEMFGDPVVNEKGWEVAPLRDNVEEMFLGPFGSSLKINSYVPQEESYCMVYEQKHAIKGTIDLDNHYINKQKYDSLERFSVKEGDFIMSCRGTIGKLFRLPNNSPMGIIHPSLMKIRLKEDSYSPTFFQFMLVKIIANERTNGNCVQMAITAKELGAKKMILPPKDKQQQFAARVSLIERQKSEVQKAINDLEILLASRMQYWFG